MSQLRLPVIQPKADGAFRSSGEGSLGRDGRRKRPYPADVSGRWLKARRAVYALLIAIWAVLPWIRIGEHPAVFLDIERRAFFLFGLTFNAQDVWLLFFALSGLAFGLVYLTALLGRVWCGWACPQTVFLEGVFRPIERMIHGPRNVALRRVSKGTFDFDRIWRTALTHAMYLLAAALVAHIILAYFVSLPRLFEMVRAKPAAHPEAFAWSIALTVAMYGNFAFFREQFCVVVCPYGRLQSVLLDDDSLVVGYDEKRGEPRGKAGKTTGDCVDCNRCVVVCPTAIDIRDGLQLDCLACTACIDACDEVMDRLHRPRGLIRYDSQRGLRGEKRRILRPRFYVYTALLLVGAIVATFAFRGRQAFEANIVRLPGAPYTREGGTIRNGFELHVVNKQSERTSFEIRPVPESELAFTIPISKFELEPFATQHAPFFVTMQDGAYLADRPFVLRIEAHTSSGKSVGYEARAVFLGAKP